MGAAGICHGHQVCGSEVIDVRSRTAVDYVRPLAAVGPGPPIMHLCVGGLVDMVGVGLGALTKPKSRY